MCSLLAAEQYLHILLLFILANLSFIPAFLGGPLEPAIMAISIKTTKLLLKRCLVEANYYTILSSDDIVFDQSEFYFIAFLNFAFYPSVL